MKLRAFHGSDGDCLLLSLADGEHHVLVDGGRSGAYRDNARGVLAALREANQKLDLVCVSHIDDDHISGVLTLVEEELAWRVFQFAEEFHPGEAEEPDHPRPPEVAAVWHNALFQLVGEDLELRVASELEQSAGLFRGSRDAGLRELGESLDNLTTGEASSLELSRRLAAEQLGIPVNPQSGGGLILRGEQAETVEVAEGLELRILGPSQDDVDRLRSSFQEWLDDHQERLEEIRAELREDEEDLSAALVANPMLAASLGQGAESVTPPNLASILLLAEDENHSVLLTGDGVSDEILQGLAHHGLLDLDDEESRLHVSVLKVQHHGAVANVTDDFVQRVTADHYLFCGNGRHHNPELEVVRAFAEARLGTDESDPIGPDDDFKFWFTSGPESDLTSSQKGQMEKVHELVQELIAHSGGRLAAEFLKDGSFEVLG